MPSFTMRIPNLQNLGPVIEVAIGVPLAVADTLNQQGRALPGPVKVAAMIDTGATSSAITPDIVRRLGIVPVGIVNITTPSCERFTTYQHHVLFGLPNGIFVETTEVIEAPLAGQHIQCLIGRDILKSGVLIYNGYAEMVTFSQ